MFVRTLPSDPTSGTKTGILHIEKLCAQRCSPSGITNGGTSTQGNDYVNDYANHPFDDNREGKKLTVGPSEGYF